MRSKAELSFAGFATSRSCVLKQRRVLLADGSSQILTVVSELLSRRFEVVGCVLDGEQAVEATLRLRPDVVVLDVMMPVVNGIEAARRLRQLGSQAKIVFLTGIEDPEYIAAAWVLGAKGFIFKSCLYKDLALGILAALEGRTFCSSHRESA